VIYTPAAAGIRTSLFVSSFSKETLNKGTISSPVSGTLTTDLAYIVRFVLPTPTVIRRYFWSNGATAATNTVQVGIYNDDLSTFLLGTATVASGTSALQFDNVTDTNIAAGRYWMACVVNGTTTTLMRQSTLTNHGSAIYSMAAARPLPATLVPAVAAAANTAVVLPLFGFTSIA
jgi:hypothetical protein